MKCGGTSIQLKVMMMNEGFVINFMMPIIIARRLNIPLEEANEIVKNSLKEEYKDLWYGD